MQFLCRTSLRSYTKTIKSLYNHQTHLFQRNFGTQTSLKNDAQPPTETSKKLFLYFQIFAGASLAFLTIWPTVGAVVPFSFPASRRELTKKS